MYQLLEGLSVIECSSFVAAPSAGLYLSQLGAEVTRIDHVAGGPDYRRWPVSETGESFYWEGLNRGKNSVAVNVRDPAGRALIQDIITAPGDGGGILITNYPADGFLSHDLLSEKRKDLITIRIMGTSDGRPAVDYTVNSAIGLPYMTGPDSLGDVPVNHVLPAWDLLAGSYAAFALMAAIHYRARTGEGQEIRIPLEDIAIASLGNLGQIAEVMQSGQDRPRIGNDLYGAFGRDFITSDKKRIMIVALTARQWTALIITLRLEDDIALLESKLGVKLCASESIRYQYRSEINALIQNRVSQWEFEKLSECLSHEGGCWGAYNTLLEAVTYSRTVQRNPMFDEINNISGFKYPVAGSPATCVGRERKSPQSAHMLGTDTFAVLQDRLGLSEHDCNMLAKKGIVRGCAI
jgi:2-methylfumaryl-CoA isomerase